MNYAVVAVFLLVSFEAGRRRSLGVAAIWVLGWSWGPAIFWRFVTEPTPDQTVFALSIAGTALGAAAAVSGFALSALVGWFRR